MISTTLEAALSYARRGWRVHPVGINKKPLTKHGHLDATTDPLVITEWFTKWPNAQIGIATGQSSGIVVLDVDISDIVHGGDSLEGLGVLLHPETITAHSPRGGYHIFFASPGHHVKTRAGVLGPGLDVRGDGGYITVPPGPGRFWDPVLGLDTALAPMPIWMKEQKPAPGKVYVAAVPKSPQKLSRYAETAIDNAVQRIRNAPAGQQETILNASVYSIARLAGEGKVSPELALDLMLIAGKHMPSLDAHRPWRQEEVSMKVRRAFLAGLRASHGAHHAE